MKTAGYKSIAKKLKIALANRFIIKNP